jgi:hypothetical protein
MNSPLVPELAAFFWDYPWSVAMMGVVVACAAFVCGRRFLVARSSVASQPMCRSPAVPVADVFLHGSLSERRVAARRRGNCVEVLVTEHPDEPAVHGWVLDRSLGGVCILVEHPLEKRLPMLIRPRNCPTSTPWTSVDILSCRADQEGWKVHCRFDRVPEYNVLLLFG